MSARNTLANKQKRASARLMQKYRTRSAQRDNQIAHGACVKCQRRRTLWLPARLCKYCIERLIADGILSGPSVPSEVLSDGGPG